MEQGCATGLWSRGRGTLLRNIIQIETANGSACGLNSSGKVYCWGSGDYTGTYPIGTDLADRINRTFPLLVLAAGGAVGSSLSNAVSLVSDNLARFCALIDNGTVVCWGRYIHQFAGGGLLWIAPYQIPNLNNAVRISVGDSILCAAKENNTVQCYGDAQGLGDGTYRPSSASVTVVTVKNSDNNGDLQGALYTTNTRYVSRAHLSTNQMQCWGSATDPISLLLAPTTYAVGGSSTVVANLTPKTALASLGGSPIELGMVYAHPVRLCRDGYELCCWNKVYPEPLGWA